jgi:hypothetical protein
VTGERPLQPPSGAPPPTAEELPDGTTLHLAPLAEEVCRRYRQEFTDEEARYGAAGNAWCVHDNQYVFDWAVLHLDGSADLMHEVTWLGDVLESRDFPVDRLVRNLDIAAEVAGEQVDGTWGEQLGSLLRQAAGHVRETFLSE